MEIQRVVLEHTGKWFLAEPRKYETDLEYWYCIHLGTLSKPRLERNIEYQQRRTNRDDNLVMFVFEARNKTQVHEWLARYGYITDHQGTRTTHMDIRERRIRQAELAIERAQAEIDRVLRLPDEPTFADDAPNVIYFQHKFNSRSKSYDYAAIKAGDGLWYTTGPASPNGYTWDQLITWHLSETNVDSTIYSAKKFRPIN